MTETPEEPIEVDPSPEAPPSEPEYPSGSTDPRLRDWAFTIRTPTSDPADVQRLAYAEAVRVIEAEGFGVERVGVGRLMLDPQVKPPMARAWFANVIASGRLPR